MSHRRVGRFFTQWLPRRCVRIRGRISLLIVGRSPRPQPLSIHLHGEQLCFDTAQLNVEGPGAALSLPDKDASEAMDIGTDEAAIRHPAKGARESSKAIAQAREMAGACALRGRHAGARRAQHGEHRGLSQRAEVARTACLGLEAGRERVKLASLAIELRLLMRKDRLDLADQYLLHALRAGSIRAIGSSRNYALARRCEGGSVRPADGEGRSIGSRVLRE